MSSAEGRPSDGWPLTDGLMGSKGGFRGNIRGCTRGRVAGGTQGAPAPAALDQNTSVSGVPTGCRSRAWCTCSCATMGSHSSRVTSEAVAKLYYFIVFKLPHAAGMTGVLCVLSGSVMLRDARAWQ